MGVGGTGGPAKILQTRLWGGPMGGESSRGTQDSTLPRFFSILPQLVVLRRKNERKRELPAPHHIDIYLLDGLEQETFNTVKRHWGSGLYNA